MKYKKKMLLCLDKNYNMYLNEAINKTNIYDNAYNTKSNIIDVLEDTREVID